MPARDSALQEPDAALAADAAPPMADSAPPIPPAVPTPPTSRVPAPLRVAVNGLFVIALLAFMQAADKLLLPVAIAVVLALVLAPAVRRLRRHGVPEMLGAALLVGALLVVTGVTVSSLGQPASEWFARAPAAAAQLMERLERLRASIPVVTPAPPHPDTTAPPTLPRASPRAPQPAASGASAPAPAPPQDTIREKIASEGIAITRAALGGMVTFAISAAATVILLYFLLASEHWLLACTVQAIPRTRTRAQVLAGVRCTEREISRFLGALTLINIVVGTLTALAVGWLGLPNPLLWGALAGALNFIPYLGPIVMCGLLLLAGAFSLDGPAVAGPALAYFAVHAVESNFVTPWLAGRHLSLSPLAVFVSVMFWGWMWGFAGALIAVPLLIVIRNICKHVRRLKLMRAYLEGGGPVRPPSLRALLRERRHRHPLHTG